MPTGAKFNWPWRPPALGDYAVGKAAHQLSRSAQDHGFQAIVMIQVDMQGG